jgi:hypothetical protein
MAKKQKTSTRCTLDERDVTLAWQKLFRGKEITPKALAEADELLDGLSGESPLHLRFATELGELKKLHAGRQVVSPKRRASK